ncbi:mitochondrial import inner membrane translocase subunit TIM50 isoform X1 [Cryptomeria japonica]|uniref:mitochondrial import inner membrane translocase subunit TIM50 isoform X1 n=1 Tax=Cryptomeria japonica TaxID=3369 RepID=UPI0027DA02F2|nr:mitochondrial import inner membrane translocase subunit TIM50 isoform X1 [Cryptomeria japonica]
MYRVVNSMMRHSNIRAIASNDHGLMRPLSAAAPSSPSPSAYASTIDGSNEAASSSSSSSASSSSPSKASPSSANQRAWSFFKFFLSAASTAAIATAGYATYAYSTEEVEEKAAALRKSANYNIPNDASTLEWIHGFLYSATMSVPSKAAELYLDIRRSIEEQVKGFAAPSSEKLLPDLLPQEQHVFTLVLDLNETLVYSDWKRERGWRTFKRPGVDAFLEHLAHFYEIVVFSDQLNMYVDPIMERLDQKGCVRYRLSRDATQYVNGKHYRDLSKLNRDPAKVIYLSGHAGESCLQAENAIQITPWKLEPDDTSLLDLLPFLEYVACHRPADIRPVISSYQGRDIATEFRERTKEHQRRMQEQKQQGRFWRRTN